MVMSPQDSWRVRLKTRLSRYIQDNALQNVAGNVGWLTLDLAFRFVVSLALGIWMARYLGPSDYGLLSYCLSFVALFGSVAGLGLNSIVVRDIVRTPAQAEEILVRALVLRVLAGMLTASAAVGAVHLFKPDNSLVQTMVVILSFTLVLNASEVIAYWYESQVSSRYTVWIGDTVLAATSVARIALILLGASVIAFAWVATLEAGLVLVGFVAIYLIHQGFPRGAGVDLAHSRTLLKDSLPLVGMSLMLVVYTRIDIIMVEHYLGAAQTGVYAIASRLAESWFVFAVILTKSMFPHLIGRATQDEEIFNKDLEVFYSFMFWFAAVMALIICVLAGTIVNLLFSSDYAGAAQVVRIYVWSGIAVFAITASSRWFLLREKHVGLLLRATLGGAANILLNLWLIPRYGLSGAATATVVSYAIVAYGYDLLDPQARGQWRLKLSAIKLPITVLRNRLQHGSPPP